MATVGSIVVDLKANAAQFHAEMGRARESIGSTSREFRLGGRAFEAAGAGLDRIHEGAGSLAPLLDQVAMKGDRLGGIFGLIGKGATAIGVGFAAFELTQQAQSWVALGMSAEKYAEVQDRIIANTDRLTDLTRTAFRASLDVQQGMTERATQRSVFGAQLGNDPLAQARVELNGRLDLIEIEKQKSREAAFATFTAKAEAIKKEDLIDTQRAERVEAQQRLLGERLAAIDRETDDKRATAKVEFTKKAEDADKELFARDLQRNRTVLDTENELRQSQLQAMIDVAAGRQDLGRVFDLQASKQIDGIRAAAAKQVETWQLAFRRGELDATSFETARTKLAQDTAVKIISIEQQIANQRRAVLATAFPAFQLPDVGAFATAAQQAIDKLRGAAAAVRQTGLGREGIFSTFLGGGPGAGAVPQFGAPGAGVFQPPSLAPHLAEVDGLQRAWAAVNEEQRAYQAALVTQEREAQRPRLFEGLQAVNTILGQATVAAQGLAEAEANGTITADQAFTERQRVAKFYADALQDIIAKFAGTPAVVDAAKKAMEDLDFGRFGTLVTNAAKALDTAKGSVDGFTRTVAASKAWVDAFTISLSNMAKVAAATAGASPAVSDTGGM